MIPKRLSRNKIYSSSILDLFLDKVEFNSNCIVENYHLLEFKNDSVVIIVTNNRKEICFIKSPRYATQKLEFELPAGSIEKGETIIQAGKREVLEETGFELDDIKHFYTFNPANAISNQKAHILSGKVSLLTPAQAFNRDEVISVEWLTIDEIKKLISSNEIMDGFSMLALLLLFYSGKT